MEQLCISILIDGNPDVSAADARAIVKQLLTGVLEAQNVLGLAPKKSVPQGRSSPISGDGVVRYKTLGWLPDGFLGAPLPPKGHNPSLISSWFSCHPGFEKDASLASFLSAKEKSVVVFITTAKSDNEAVWRATGWVGEENRLFRDFVWRFGKKVTVLFIFPPPHMFMSDCVPASGQELEESRWHQGTCE